MFARRFWTVPAIVGLLLMTASHADIYRWDTGDVIPGTEGIARGRGCISTIWIWRMQICMEHGPG